MPLTQETTALVLADDFNRPDGPPGNGWVVQPGDGGSHTQWGTWYISGGALVAPYANMATDRFSVLEHPLLGGTSELLMQVETMFSAPGSMSTGLLLCTDGGGFGRYYNYALSYIGSSWVGVEESFYKQVPDVGVVYSIYDYDESSPDVPWSFDAFRMLQGYFSDTVQSTHLVGEFDNRLEYDVSQVNRLAAGLYHGAFLDPAPNRYSKYRGFRAYSTRMLTISGILPGYMVRVGNRAPVAESGGVAQLDVRGVALPITTVDVLAPNTTLVERCVGAFEPGTLSWTVPSIWSACPVNPPTEWVMVNP